YDCCILVFRLPPFDHSFVRQLAEERSHSFDAPPPRIGQEFQASENLSALYFDNAPARACFVIFPGGIRDKPKPRRPPVKLPLEGRMIERIDANTNPARASHAVPSQAVN